MKLYVGNLSFQTNDSDLKELFENHGTVVETNIIMDRETQRPRGFAFVTMGSTEEGNKAMQALNGELIDGRNLTVNEAKPPGSRDSGSRAPRGGGGRSRY